MIFPFKDERRRNFDFSIFILFYFFAFTQSLLKFDDFDNIFCNTYQTKHLFKRFSVITLDPVPLLEESICMGMKDCELECLSFPERKRKNVKTFMSHLDEFFWENYDNVLINDGKTSLDEDFAICKRFLRDPILKIIECDKTVMEDNPSGSGPAHPGHNKTRIDPVDPDPDCLSWDNCESSQSTKVTHPEDFKCKILENKLVRKPGFEFCVMEKHPDFVQCTNENSYKYEFNFPMALYNGHYIFNYEGKQTLQRVSEQGKDPKCKSPFHTDLECEVGCLRAKYWDCDGTAEFCSVFPRCVSAPNGLCSCEMKGNVEYHRIFFEDICYEGNFEFKMIKIRELKKKKEKFSTKSKAITFLTSSHILNKTITLSTNEPSLVKIIYLKNGKRKTEDVLKILDEEKININRTIIKNYDTIRYEFTSVDGRKSNTTLSLKGEDPCKYLSCEYCFDALEDYNCLESTNKTILSMLTAMIIVFSILFAFFMMFLIYYLVSKGITTFATIGKVLAFMVFGVFILLYWIFDGFRWLWKKLVTNVKKSRILEKTEEKTGILMTGVAASLMPKAEAHMEDDVLEMANKISELSSMIMDLQFSFWISLLISISVICGCLYMMFRIYYHKIIYENLTSVQVNENRNFEDNDLPVVTPRKRLGPKKFKSTLFSVSALFYICCAIPTVLSQDCTGGFVVTSPITDCRNNPNDGTLDCKLSINMEVVVASKGQKVCLSLNDADGNYLASLTVNYEKLYCEWITAKQYYTSEWKPFVTYSKRCPRSGICDGCPSLINLDSEITKELQDGMEEYGYNSCEASCGCAGCGCFFCYDGCLFSRWYIIPSGPLYRVSSIMTRKCTPRVEIELVSNLGEKKVIKGDLTAKGEQVNDFLSVTLLREPNIESLNFAELKLIENMDDKTENHLAVATMANSQVPGTIGDYQFNSDVDLIKNRKQQTIFPDYSVKCVKSGSAKIDCTFPYSGIKTLSSKTMLPMHYAGYTLEHKPGKLSSESADSSISLFIKSTREISVSQKSTQVKPVFKFLRITGCFSCQEGARIEAEVYSLENTGIVTLTATNSDYIIYDVNLPLTLVPTKRKIAFWAPKKKVQFNMFIYSSTATYISSLIEGELDESENVMTKPPPNWADSSQDSKKKEKVKCQGIDMLSFSCWGLTAIVSKLLMIALIILLIWVIIKFLIPKLFSKNKHE